MDILRRITELRCQRGWTEYTLAVSAGLPQSTISSWYKKGMLPSLGSLEKICQGLGITLSQFFCEGENTVTLQSGQMELLQKYNGLSDTQKEQVVIFMDALRG